MCAAGRPPTPSSYVVSVCDCVLLCCACVQERELDYRSLFIHGGVAQGVARLDGHFIDCNKMFTKLTGYIYFLAMFASRSPSAPLSTAATTAVA